MRSLFAIALFAVPTFAEEPAKAALTQKQLDEGQIQLFDGESTFGWKIEGDSSVKDGVWTLGSEKAATATYLIPLPMTKYHVDFTVRGKNKVEIYSSIKGDAVPILTAEEGVKSTSGILSRGESAQYRIAVPAGTQMLIHRFTAVFSEPLPLPLFNGKDLTGWKVHDEAKKNLSKFDVTDAGELRVVNGPGDLQTTAKYADFLLQFRCKTNGDGLNSGIFFRCIEGQYQNGYECQISNKAKKTDPAKPEDYGTGAIYRRVEARKLVAKDKEWFAVTLVAHGDRFATWVNGYPVVSWHDDRMPDDNPRKGLRKAAGHLSIQGHDPTTDILFKDLKIAEFPAK